VRVYLGSDHAGFELKSAVAEAVAAAGHDVVDCGPSAYQEDDDYPVYVMRAAASVAGDPGSAGIVIGGSGNGEQIAANKIDGIRAALAWNNETARLARLHNDANVLSLGARMHQVRLRKVRHPATAAKVRHPATAAVGSRAGPQEVQWPDERRRRTRLRRPWRGEAGAPRSPAPREPGGG